MDLLYHFAGNETVVKSSSKSLFDKALNIQYVDIM